MFRIEVYEKADDIVNMIQILEMIILLIQDGYIQGVDPSWELFDEEQNE